MWKTILMPTDGSTISEAPLPLVAALARAQDAEVVLARVVEPMTWYSSVDDGPWAANLYEQLQQAAEEEAQAQVDELVTRLRTEGVRVRREVMFGTASAHLLDLEARIAADLVVMATHGRSGLTRFALGSIADRMVREGTVPVLVVRPLDQPVEPPEVALVPLDGSEVAEQALPLVKALAGRPVQRIRLLRVQDPEEDAATVRDYLERVRHEFADIGVPVTAETAVGDPSEAIIQAAHTANLVIIGTHGRGGFDRFRHGSVADRVVRQATTPVLLVRAAATEAKASFGRRLTAAAISAGGV